ncbi:MAG: hypothetical protein ACE5IQ_08355 [Candidatus Methylomirabilales bacterium]
MWKFWTGLVAIAVLLWGGTPYAHGQKATEMFIPLGQSPGLSHKVTIIGTIQSVKSRGQSITVAGPSRTWRAKVTDRTRIWLDRSTLRLPNQYGTFATLRKGQVVEIKYQGKERKDNGRAEWIKVQVTAPNAKASESRK